MHRRTDGQEDEGRDERGGRVGREANDGKWQRKKQWIN